MARHRNQPLYLLSSLILLFTVCAAEFHSIWPTHRLNGMPSSVVSRTNEMITEELKKDLENDPTKLYVSQSERSGKTWYWYADLTDELVEKYKQFPEIRHVVKPNNARAQSFRAVTNPKLPPPVAASSTNQPNAPDQLRVLSLPKDKKLADSKGYVYDESAGKGVTIYVVDSGLTPTSPEFESTQISWIFAGPFASHDMDDIDVGDKNPNQIALGHGTCMASIALGKRDGVAKAASLTVVRSDVFSTKDKENAAAEIWIDALSLVHDDIAKKPAGVKAIVSMSIGVTDNIDKTYQDCYADTFQDILTDLDAMDVVQTAAPGNTGDKIQAFPALLAKKLPSGNSRLPNLIVVGGFVVDSRDKDNGDFENDIQDEEIKIYGPADDMSKSGTIASPGLECASRDGIGYHRGESGTSHATAAVSGLLATFMSQGMTGAEARKRLFDTGVVRRDGWPKTAWNGLDGTEEVIKFPSDSDLPS